MRWMRYRFYTDAADYRPVLFNPAWPWWCSGTAVDVDDSEYAVIVAYLPVGEDLSKYWPEAYGHVIDGEERPIFFTDRFPEPNYYDPLYTGPAMDSEAYDKYLKEREI